MTHTVIWLTDIHLEMVSPNRLDALLADIDSRAYDALVIGGDIADAGTLSVYLQKIADTLKKTVYFVLGNHDYYGGDIPTVRDLARQLTLEHPYLRWLPEAGVVELTEQTALVGHGGWSDGGYGDFLLSSVMLNDYVQIASLVTANQVERLEKLRSLGRSAARQLRPQLTDALTRYQHVYVLTHSPPFQQACWHEGKTPDNDDPYLPHFTCKAIGDLLLELAGTYSNTQITVLCGHTHGTGEAQILPNLRVITGGATYGEPAIQRVIRVT